MRLAPLWLLLGGCVFTPPGILGSEGGTDAIPTKDGSEELDASDPDGSDLDASPLDGEVVEAGPPDAMDAGAPDLGTSCTANTDFCDGRWKLTCNAAGDGVVSGSEVECDYTCDDGLCVRASNLDPSDIRGCGVTGPALTPVDGSTITIDGSAISCAPNCGDGLTTSIPPSGMLTPADAPPSSWYCLSRVDITRRTIVVQGANVMAAVALFVDGDAIIQGRVAIRGGDATLMTAGSAGLGAGAGGPLSGGNGMDGLGLCPGLGGRRAGTIGNYASGGGGGGGYGGTGGSGGTGRNADDNTSAPGGDGGTVCRIAELIPLSGGSGGGSGGDNSCGPQCGWAGGGGGGALQITSRNRIRISGSLDASGGNGFGALSGGPNPTGGGGGGGSGGAFLLEAPAIDFTGGSLVVAGGNGGLSSAGNGGPGATDQTIDGAVGASFGESGESGSGGGGGAGRVRMNRSTGGSMCSVVTPSAACSEGPLMP